MSSHGFVQKVGIMGKASAIMFCSTVSVAVMTTRMRTRVSESFLLMIFEFLAVVLSLPSRSMVSWLCHRYGFSGKASAIAKDVAGAGVRFLISCATGLLHNPDHLRPCCNGSIVLRVQRIR